MRFVLIVLSATFLTAALIHFSYIKWVGGSRYKAESQEIDNIVKVEEFLYEEDSGIEVMVVGTSLSTNAQHADFQNLSFPGGAPVTILKIIAESQKVPEKILLETNFLYYSEDPEMIAKFQSDVATTLPMIQGRYRPMSLLLGAIKGGHQEAPGLPNVPTWESIIPEEKIKKVENHVAAVTAEVGRDELDEVVSGIKKVIDELETRGVEFVFFETPFDAEISSQPRLEQWRKVLGEEFPNHPINRLAIDETMTSDGIHLCLKGVLEMGEQLGYLAGRVKQTP